MENKKRMEQILLTVFLAIVCGIVLLPLVAAFFTSFKARDEIITLIPHFFPKRPTLDNYERLFMNKNVLLYLKNSAIVSVALMAINVVLSLMGAFAFTWMKLKSKRFWENTILSTYMFPTILFAMPYYVMCNKLGLLNQSVGLILTYLAFSLPFSIWMLKNNFEALPKELVEAGYVDGCNHLQCLFKIIIPVSLPAIAVVAIYSFIIGFSEYMFASMLMTEESARTLPLLISILSGRYHTDFGLLMAASMVMIFPITILFLCVQKYFVSGLVSGTVNK